MSSPKTPRASAPYWPATLFLLLAAGFAAASSHREAPLIANDPLADNTDVYAFVSPDDPNKVTLIANWIPFEEPSGGPNFYRWGDDIRYEIHIENNGDLTGPDDIVFRFNFQSGRQPVTVDVGIFQIPAPFDNLAPVTDILDGNPDGYTFEVVRNGGPAERTVNARTGGDSFVSPLPNIGPKTFPGTYDDYARQAIYEATIPGCGAGQVFAGPRDDGFYADIAGIFDLLNTGDAVGPRDAKPSSTEGFNVHSIALQVPIDCLTQSESDPIIGVWASSSRRRLRTLTDDPTFDQPNLQSGDWVQVSRLGMPLVNEVAIGLPEKNLFNASHPRDDDAFLTYVTHPTLPELIQILFGVEAPKNFPRQDLDALYLTGIPGLNQDGSRGDMLRLNTAIPPTPFGQQDSLGVLAGDLAGFPNGRRLSDDVVDISLRAAAGAFQYTNFFGEGPSQDISVSGEIGSCTGRINAAGTQIQNLNCRTSNFPGIFRAQIFRISDGANVANDLGPIFFRNVPIPQQCQGPGFPNCLGVRYFNNQNPNGAVVGPIVRQGGGSIFNPETDAPGGLQPLTDGVLPDSSTFDQAFPYLTTPIPGASGSP